MSTDYCNALGWIPSDQAHAGKTISTITTPTYDRQGGAMHISVTRPHFNTSTNQWETIVLYDGTDSTSSGFGAQVLTIGAAVTSGEPIALSMARTDGGMFAVVDPSGTISYV
jgi:hypothetical protein